MLLQLPTVQEISLSVITTMPGADCFLQPTQAEQISVQSTPFVIEAITMTPKPGSIILKQDTIHRNCAGF